MLQKASSSFQPLPPFPFQSRQQHFQLLPVLNAKKKIKKNIKKKEISIQMNAYYLDGAICCHDSNFDIFGTCLDNFQQRFNGQLDGLILVHLFLVILFQKFTNSLGASTDRISLS